MPVSKNASLKQTHPAKTKTAEDTPLLLAVLRVLQSLVKNAAIELPNGVRIFVDHDCHRRSIRFHCDKENSPCDEPCQDLFDFEDGLGETIAICRNLEPLGCSGELAGETEQLRRLGINKFEKTLDALNSRERANLLRIFGEDEFRAFLETNVELEDLQSRQYWFTNRINRLRTTNRKNPKRPVKEQRKVGAYLYTLQPSQKGGDYWYLHFSRDGKRHHVYLGKETPTFEPAKDLAQKRKPLSRSARA
jgi:hypothetical protein